MSEVDSNLDQTAETAEAPNSPVAASSDQGESDAVSATDEVEPAEAASVGEASTGVEVEASDGEASEPVGPKNPKFKWYVVHTYSMYEEKAKNALLELVRQKGLEEKFGEIIVPQTTKETLTKTGKRKISVRASFPGYIVVEMELTDYTMSVVKDTPRITGFVGNAQKPRPLPDNEVHKLTSPDDAVLEESANVAEVAFRKGENVKVKEGPFSNFDGTIDEVSPTKAKLRVLVKIFGRETPVELDYHQVEKI